MNGERKITEYVEATRTLRAVRAQAPLKDDIPGYEAALREAKAIAMERYRALSGGQLAEAERRLKREHPVLGGIVAVLAVVSWYAYVALMMVEP